MSTKLITESMKAHHDRVFSEHGATPRGVDWGANEDDLTLRYDKLLDLVLRGRPLGRRASVLDVGCGYGGLLSRIQERELEIDYTGIDFVEAMIVEAKKRYPNGDFRCGDIFEAKGIGTYDYLLCNGIMTQKLDASIPQMDKFVRSLIRRMFDLCSEGIAFNMMSSRVNFMVDNLFYRSPAEMLSWCMAEITPNVALDHAYPLYEFMMYLYKNDRIR